MSQEGLILLAFKVAAIGGMASMIAFTVQYTLLAPWWRDQIGRTIVIEGLLVIGLLAVSVLSLFFRFNRLTSEIAAWVDVVLIGAVTPVMAWRMAVFQKIHRSRGNPPDPDREA